MAGWTHVDTSSSNPTNTEDTKITLVVPAAVQEHDLLVAVVGCETESFAGINIQGPAGWNRIALREQTVGSNGPVLAMFWKLAGPTDASAVLDFTWAHAATGRVGAIVAKRGVHRTTPLDVVATPMVTFAGQVYAGEADASPDLTTELVIAAYLVNHTAARTFTPNADLTERVDVAGNGTGGDDYLSLHIADDDSAALDLGQYPADASGAYTLAIGVRAFFLRNPSPNAPTVAAIDAFDATAAKTLSHTFSDDMPGDVQTARQWLIYRVSDGVLVHDTGKVATAATDYVMAGGTLANGSQYQAQVRVWDVDDNASTYSALRSFYASAPPVASITSPTAAEVIEASSHLITWDYTDPEAEAQSAFRVVVTRTDVAGVLLDTGKTMSALTSRLVTGLLDGGSYTADVYVWDAKGIMSAVDSVAFTVDYAQPPTPTITTTDGGHFIRIAITNPAPVGDEVVAAYNDLYRREAGGEWIRIASDLDVNSIYDDYAAASGVTYEYRASAFTGTGGVMDSAVGDGSLVLSQTWIHDPADPLTSWGFRTRTKNRSSTKQHAVATMQFEGRDRPVAEFGDSGTETVTFGSLLMADTDDLVTFRALVDRKSTVCYRDSRGRKVFGVIDAVTETDHLLGAEVPITVVATYYSEEV